MFRLLLVIVVLAVATYTDCAVTNGFQRITDYIPSSWGAPADLTDDDLKAKGHFTSWINTDNSVVGTGDFENVKAILNKQKTSGSCALYCSQPAGVEWKLKDTTYQSDIERCLVIHPAKFGEVKDKTYPGYNCLDAYQNDASKAGFCTREKCIEIGMRKPNSRKRSITCDQCPDMEVRYLCPKAKPSDGSCPSASGKREIGSSLDSQLEELDNQMQLREKELSDLVEKANVLEARELDESEDKINELKRLLVALTNEEIGK